MISEALRNPLSLFNVKGKVAIITGASGTFGRAVALSLGLDGREGRARLGHRERPRRSRVAEVGAMLGRRGRHHREASRQFGGCASDPQNRAGPLRPRRHARQWFSGKLNKPGFIQDQSVEEWESVMDANVKGIYVMAKAVGTCGSRKRSKVKMLVMSSVPWTARQFSPAMPAIAPPKAPRILSRAFSPPNGRNTAPPVNAIAPTVFRSQLTEWMWGDSEVGQATTGAFALAHSAEASG